METEFWAEHQCVPVNKPITILSSNIITSTTTSGSSPSSFVPYDFPGDEEEYLTPNNFAETTPRQCNCAAGILTAGTLYLNSLPEVQKSWGHSISNLNDYNSNWMAISSILEIPDITNRWCQPEQTRLEYTDTTNMAHDIFTIVPHRVGVGACCSLGWDITG